MKPTATPIQPSRVLDDDTAIRHHQAVVRSLALTSATLFRNGDKIGANASFETMMDVYMIQMRAPHSQHWTSLPSLGSIHKLMVEEYANAEGISDRQAIDFGLAVDAKMRLAFESHIPSLRKINNSSSVSLDTMQDCVGHIMMERDYKVAELSAPISSVLGRIRSRFMAQKGGDWNDNYLKGLDDKTFASAVANTAHGASMRATLSGRNDADHVHEITFLADLAEAHAGPNTFGTSRLVAATRDNVLGLEGNRPFQPSPTR
jgi:hypothetical protein